MGEPARAPPHPALPAGLEQSAGQGRQHAQLRQGVASEVKQLAALKPEAQQRARCATPS